MARSLPVLSTQYSVEKNHSPLEGEEQSSGTPHQLPTAVDSPSRGECYLM